MIESGMKLSLDRRHFISTGLLCAATGLSRAATPTPRVILVLGDSLSAEYGLKRGTGWVALLEQRLRAENMAATVINASISGETTAGGRSRLKSLLSQYRPKVVIIELGANDALRGLSLQATQANLDEMTQTVRQAGARSLLLGMRLPPNYGQDYGARFAALFGQVARSNKTALVPFLLEGVADVPESGSMFQSDRIHPREAAQPIMLANVWPELRKLLK